MYAPQQGRTDEEKQHLYDNVDEEIELSQNDELLVMCGDFNGHVGEAADGYEGVHGGYGLDSRG